MKKVMVRATAYHTYQGKEYNVGDTYEIEEQHVDTVVTQGKAVRADQGQPGQAQEGQQQGQQQEGQPKRGDSYETRKK
jgi:hypothetical protein